VVSDDIHEVGADEREALIEWLGDSPGTVQSIHRLRRGLGRGLVAGPADQPRVALVASLLSPKENAAFGDDPELVWSLLRGVDGWVAVHVPVALAGQLARVIERETGRGTTPMEEIYFLPGKQAAAVSDPPVRRLTAADVPMMEAATEALGMEGWRFGSAAALIRESVAAGAVVDGELVAVGFAGYASDRHAEVGIVTREDHRNRGLSTAAAALVFAELVRSGKTPVWSTSEENVASQRVAAKLGFVETSRRVYVNRG